MHISFSYSFRLLSKAKDFATKKKEKKCDYVSSLFLIFFFFSINREYRYFDTRIYRSISCKGFWYGKCFREGSLCSRNPKSSFLMICRDIDKSNAIILEEYLLELCISSFLTLLDFLARQTILQHKKEKEKKCDYVSSFFLIFLFFSINREYRYLDTRIYASISC